jgi:hypothetical protein
MVYEVIWTDKAVDSYARNMLYLEQAWTQKETDLFLLYSSQDRLAQKNFTQRRKGANHNYLIMNVF